MFRFAPLVHIPDWVTHRFPNAVWRMDPGGKEVYLAFDDGPVPEVTPWVLELLGRENIKATFFCVGENAVRNYALYESILSEGHSVGNHTFNHLQGLKTGDAEYFTNIGKASGIIDSDLFRPPHGFLRKRQFKFLSENYRIIMWDVCSMDYQASLKPDKIIRNVRDFARPGSIITFHDSVKAEKNLKTALPAVIRILKSEGYRFLPIPYLKKVP